MSRRLTFRHESWPLARPFSISRGVKTTAKVVVVEITDGAVVGRGECVPYPRYRENISGVMAEIEGLTAQIEAGMDRIEINAMMDPGAARNAVDCAL